MRRTLRVANATGTLSLRADHQGKTLAPALLALELEVPEPVLATTAPEGEG